MINYFVCGRYTHTMDRFLSETAQELATVIHVLPYERLVNEVSLPVGPCIFADIDILGPGLRMLAIALHAALQDCPGFTTLNDPRRSLGKYHLLRLLHEQGVNRHTVFRSGENLGSASYPVFLRYMDDHGGPRSPLLPTAPELRKSLTWQRLKGRASRVMIVEFNDTSDHEGIFRKYAAFRVGGRIVPRHMLVGRDWVQKHPGGTLLEQRFIEEEAAYVRDNPHQEQLMEIFQAAAVEYGRIDYGLCGGRLQVWEINTNPMVLSRENLEVPERRASQEFFLGRVVNAFRELDTPCREHRRIVLPRKLRLKSRLLSFLRPQI